MFASDAEMRSKKDSDDKEVFKDYALGKRKRGSNEDSGRFGGLLKRVLVSHDDTSPVLSVRY